MVLKHRPLDLAVPLVPFFYRPPANLQGPLIVPPKVLELKSRFVFYLLALYLGWFWVEFATEPWPTLREITAVILLGFREFFFALLVGFILAIYGDRVLLSLGLVFLSIPPLKYVMGLLRNMRNDSFFHEYTLYFSALKRSMVCFRILTLG